MTWHIHHGLSGPRHTTYQDGSDPTKFVLEASGTPINYRTPSGIEPVDFTPVRVSGGWEVTRNDWHLRLRDDGWIGFGAKGGQHWLGFRLAMVGYVHGPTLSWELIADTPTYNTGNLTRTLVTQPVGPAQSAAVVGLNATWTGLWTTPGGGRLDVRWQLSGERFKEELVINQAARTWIAANRPPSTPASETFLAFVFEVDWANIPKVVLDGVQQSLEGTLDPGDLPLELRDALDELLAFLPLTEGFVEGLPGNSFPLARKLWKAGDTYYLAVGGRVNTIAGLPAGSLVFDPTIEANVAAGADDAHEYGDGSYNYTGTELHIYSYSSTSSVNYRVSGARWAISLPTAVTIGSNSYASLYGNQAEDDINATVYAHDVDNSQAFSNDAGNRILGVRALTTASASWVGDNLGTGWHNSPSLQTVIQEWADRPGRVSGDALMLLFYGKTDTTKTFKWRSIEYSSGTYAALLHIEYTLTVDEYTPAASETGTETVEPSVTVGDAPASGPAVSSNPAVGGTIAFGDVEVGLTDTADLVISEIGTEALTLSSPVIGGLHQTSFSVLSPSFPLTIEDGGAPVTITLQVAMTSSGTKSGTLSLSTNDPSNTTIEYSLSATGVVVGALPDASTLTRKLEIDWDQDNTYGHALADLSDRILGMSWNEGFGYGAINAEFAEPSAFSVRLHNNDGAFWQDNSAATFYGMLVRGLRIRYTMTYDGIDYVRWVGNIVSVEPTPNPSSPEVRSVLIQAQDSMLQLLDEEIVPKLQRNARTDEVIEETLKSGRVVLPYQKGHWVLGYSRLGVDTKLPDSSAFLDLDTGGSVLPYAGAFAGTDRGVNIQAYLREIVAAELGGRFFYNPRTGKFTFQGRRYNVLRRNVEVTLTEADLGENTPPPAFGQHIVNSVTVGYTRLAEGAAGSVLWSAAQAVRVAPWETRRMTVQYRDPNAESNRCAGVDFIPPVSGVDYAFNRSEDGSGTNMTSQISVFVTFGANAADIKIVNHTNETVYATTLRVRGTPLVAYDNRSATAQDATSIALNGRQKITLDVPMIDNDETVESYANQYVRRHATAALRFQAVQLYASEQSDWLWEVLNYGIGTRVRLNLSGDAWTAHDAEYILVGVTHEDNPGWSPSYVVTWHLEPAALAAGWILGVSQLGIETELVL